MRYLWCLGLLLAGPVAADTVFSYDGFYSRMKKAYKADYNDITMAFVLRKQGTADACDVIRVYLKSDIHFQDVSMAEGGEINLPYDEALKDSKANLIIEQADNVSACDLQFRIRSRMPLTANISVAQLKHYQQQFASLMSDLAGMGRYWMPAVSGVGLEFRQTQTMPVLSEQVLHEITDCEQQRCVIALDKLKLSQEQWAEAHWQFEQAPTFVVPYIER